jgi:hypothetical protein
MWIVVDVSRRGFREQRGQRERVQSRQRHIGIQRDVAGLRAHIIKTWRLSQNTCIELKVAKLGLIMCIMFCV